MTAAILATGCLVWSRALAVEGQQAPVLPLPKAPSAEGGQTDVGVWVVEGPVGSGDLPEVAGPAAAESQGLTPGQTAHVVVMGKDYDVRTNAGTVRELLSAMGIEPDGNDRVLPPPGTPLSSDPSIRIVDSALLVGSSPQPSSFQSALVREHFGNLAKPRTERDTTPAPSPASYGSSQTGEASWYDRPGLTAASPTLPFGTTVLVTNVATGASVTVVIDDRGPFGGRIIDLSDEAFERIAPLSQGVAQVRLSW
ncbi:MAG: RlpA-like double-psi beta-barrel domain-containing protein [Actinomycetota bacterium]